MDEQSAAKVENLTKMHFTDLTTDVSYRPLSLNRPNQANSSLIEPTLLTSFQGN